MSRMIDVQVDPGLGRGGHQLGGLGGDLDAGGDGVTAAGQFEGGALAEPAGGTGDENSLAHGYLPFVVLGTARSEPSVPEVRSLAWG